MEVAASVVGLLLAGAKVSAVINEFISTAKNVPALARQLHDEVNSFRYVLHKIQETVIETKTLASDRAAHIDINHLCAALTAAVCTFSELERELDRIRASGVKIELWDRVKWMRAGKNLSQISLRLNRHETSLTLIFTILTSESLAKVLSSKERLASAFTAESVPATQAESDVDPLVNDDSSSVNTLATTMSSRSVAYRAFESVLSATRPYRKVTDSDSLFSRDSTQSDLGRWSLYTAYSNDSVFSLPISLREIAGVSLADRSIGPVLLPIPPDTIYQHERYRIDPKKRTPVMQTPTPRWALYSAAGEGRYEEVHDLLRRGIDVNERHPEGLTALQNAVVNGHIRTVQKLLLFGADVTVKDTDSDRNLLHLAVSKGHLDVVLLLLEGTLDSSASDKTECPASSDVSTADVKPIRNQAYVQFQINRLDCTGVGPLHTAAESGNVALVNLLLDHGGNIEEIDFGGRTPIFYAWSHHVLACLLEKGAHINVTDGTLDTPLHLAMQSWEREGVLLLLRGPGVNIDAKGNMDETALHKAAAFREGSMTVLLLDEGANIEAPDRKGGTPLFAATRVQNESTMNALIARGAKVDATNLGGDTPLLYAARNGLERAVNRLLSGGADCNLEDKDGDTPLHLAASLGSLAIVELLCSKGARTGARDRKGLTPDMRASKKNIARTIKTWAAKGT